jgi:alpha-D-ribose 1-methylphosphonate 5-triphosphate synthase subunit PhnH
MAETVDIRPGFADPVIGSQRVFRLILDAMARPGRIAEIAEDLDPPVPLSVGAAALCLALADHDTPLWVAPGIRNPATTAFLRFHCGSPIVDDPSKAAFAIAPGATVPALETFGIGDDAWPETSTTLIVQIDELASGGALTLSGPGIETTHELAPAGLRGGIWDEWEGNRALFPCGIDMVLVAGARLAALPRTTAVRPCTEV